MTQWHSPFRHRRAWSPQTQSSSSSSWSSAKVNCPLLPVCLQILARCNAINWKSRWKVGEMMTGSWGQGWWRLCHWKDPYISPPSQLARVPMTQKQTTSPRSLFVLWLPLPGIPFAAMACKCVFNQANIVCQPGLLGVCEASIDWWSRAIWWRGDSRLFISGVSGSSSSRGVGSVRSSSLKSEDAAASGSHQSSFYTYEDYGGWNIYITLLFKIPPWLIKVQEKDQCTPAPFDEDHIVISHWLNISLLGLLRGESEITSWIREQKKGADLNCGAKPRITVCQCPGSNSVTNVAGPKLLLRSSRVHINPHFIPSPPALWLSLKVLTAPDRNKIILTG